jgi:L-ascorbate metabolism protein UlaG (beta-lactamase superfamily)
MVAASGTQAHVPDSHTNVEDSLSFIGTATTVLHLGGFVLLTDPNFLHRGQWAYLGWGLASRRRTDPAMRIEDLPPLDAVLLSHLHGDHFDRVARRNLAKHTPILTTPQAASRLRRRGFTEPVALGTWQQQRLTKGDDTLTITSLPGKHAFGLMGRMLPPVMGSLLEYRHGDQSRPLRIYLSGDTLMHEDLRRIRDQFPDIDVALVHLGGTRVLGMLVTMDGRQGVDLLELVRPRHAVPVHYNDYGVFKSPLSEFQGEVQRRKPATAVHYLRHGESYPLPVAGVRPS